MQKKIEIFVKLAIAATFFVPLVMIPSSFIFPFIVPKILVFRSLVLIMLGGLVILMSSNLKEYEVKMTWITLAILLFLLSFSLSTFLGADWYHSFWDNHERMLGLFTIVHYVLYYFVITSIVKEWRDWRVLFRVFLFAGSIVMFIGVLQRFNPTLLLNQSGSRVAATLGNPIYVGGYGLFLSFLGLFLALKEKVKLWRIYGAVGGLLGFVGIFLSGTRGSMLGWLAGMFVLFLCYLFLLKEHKILRRNLLILMAVGFVILGVLFAFRKTTFVEKIPALGDLLNSGLSYGTATTRIMAWSIAIEAWKDRPVFGWGPNNFFYAFNKYYKPEFLEHGWGETWFDNAHNIIMNTLAVQGAIGLALYIGLFVTVITILWKKYRDGVNDIHAVAVLTGFFVAHLVGNVFVFENPTSYLYFFFMLAFVNSWAQHGKEWLTESADEKKLNQTYSSQVSFGVSIIIASIVFILVYSTDVNPARANQATLVALRSLYTLNDPVGTYQKTVAIPSPHIDDIRNDFARTVISVAPEYIKNGYNEQAKNLIKVAFDELRKNRALHPMDIRVHLQIAQLSDVGISLMQDAQYIFESEAALEDALLKSPKRQQVQYTLAGVKLQLQKNNEAIELMKQARDNDPKIGESWWRLALVYQESRRTEDAIATIREARSRGITFDERGNTIAKAILPLELEIGTKK